MIVSVRLSFTERRQGPGFGSSIVVEANTLPVAISKAIRIFWSNLDRKHRNDVRQSGLKIEASVRKEKS